jgi:hypothetical protein
MQSQTEVLHRRSLSELRRADDFAIDNGGDEIACRCEVCKKIQVLIASTA